MDACRSRSAKTSSNIGNNKEYKKFNALIEIKEKLANQADNKRQTNHA